MACKRICSIMLAILMVSPTAITASAAEQIPTHQEQRFISSKQEIIAGIPTTVNEYECNGVIVETFSINDTNVSDAAMEAFTDALATRPRPQSEVLFPVALDSVLEQDYYYEHTRTFATNPPATTQDGKGTLVISGNFHSGKGAEDNNLYLWAENARSVAVYNELNNVPRNITMNLTLTTTRLGLSIGIPPSVSIVLEDKSMPLELGTFSNTTAVTAYWPEYSARGRLPMSISAQATVTFSFGSTSYTAITAESQNCSIGW